MSECSDLSDCLIDGVQKDCYLTGSGNFSIGSCDCASILNWIGEKCDEVSPAITFNRIFFTLLILWMSVILSLSLRTMVFAVMLKPELRILRDSIFLAILTSFSSILFNYLYLFFSFRIQFDPSFIKIFSNREELLSGNADTLINNYNHERAILSLLLSFFSLEASNFFILLSMSNLIVQVSKFNGEAAARNASQWHRVLKTVLVILVVSLVGIPLIEGLQLTSTTILIGVLFMFFFILLTIILVNKFRRLIHAVPGDNRALHRIAFVMTLFGLSSVFVAFAHLLLIVLLLLTGITVDEQEGLGQVNNIIISGTISRVTYAIHLTMVAWYLNSCSEGTILADLYPQMCWIFYWWDKENKVVFPEEDDGVFQARKSTTFVK